MGGEQPKQVSIGSCTQRATQAGEHIVAMGGNAFDAAVATGFNLMVSNPLMCSIGGGGFATIKTRGEMPVVIDFFNAMPGKGLSKDRFGKNTRTISLPYGPGVDVISGHSSIGVSGTAKGLEYLSKHYGSLPLKEVLQPTIEDARQGVPLNKTVAKWVQISAEKLHWYTPYSKSLLSTPEGKTPKEGYILKNPDLAETLEYIGNYGIDEIYHGEIAKKIVETVQEGGGIVTAQDLAEYDVIIRNPIRAEIDGFLIYSNPPPSVGGCSIIHILKAMAHLNINTMTPDIYSKIGIILHGALSNRFSAFEAHKTNQKIDLEKLYGITVDDYILEKYKNIIPSPNTTQLSTVDDLGNICSLTMSMGYGSGVAIPGTGIFMDNSLGELELNPLGFHALEPGERLVSNMSPTIAQSSSELLALGSPGASRISTALAQVLFNIIHFKMNLEQALAKPRIHWEDEKVLFEKGIELERELLPENWETIEFGEMDMYFGGVQAVSLQHGKTQAFSDPRRSGCAKTIQTT